MSLKVCDPDVQLLNVAELEIVMVQLARVQDKIAIEIQKKKKKKKKKTYHIPLEVHASRINCKNI